MSQRKAKVEHALRDVLADLVRREVRDPRVARAGLLSITRVELNVDMSVANVYVAIIGPGGTSAANAEAAVAALGRAARFLRGPAGRALNLAHPPELRFMLDRSAEMQERIRNVLREDDAKARAAGREPQAAGALGTDPAVVALAPARAGEEGDSEGAEGDDGDAGSEGSDSPDALPDPEAPQTVTGDR
ncbi:MAG: 30S ribosome-binding factor RbfA [Myxococcales bacterium]|nr:30S ribosome-binding factor RbfA [Myxococcales bacterium]